MAKKGKYIIGIDEVGRGSLAGPVTVAAVLLPRNFQFSISNFQTNSKFKIQNLKLKLKDSKKLSPRQREVWFRYIKNISVNQRTHSPRLREGEAGQRKSAICYAIASVSPGVIDRINISRAANLAATRALIKLIERLKDRKIKKLRNRKFLKHSRKKSFNLSILQSCNIYLDGGLYLNKNISINQLYPYKSASTVVKGDEKIPVITLASIIAKVTRDRYMKKLHKKYPRYDFIHNVGYGTKKHIRAIRKYGPSEIHRLTFIRKYHNIKLKSKH